MRREGPGQGEWRPGRGVPRDLAARARSLGEPLGRGDYGASRPCAFKTPAPHRPYVAWTPGLTEPGPRGRLASKDLGIRGLRPQGTWASGDLSLTGSPASGNLGAVVLGISRVAGCASARLCWCGDPAFIRSEVAPGVCAHTPRVRCICNTCGIPPSPGQVAR